MSKDMSLCPLCDTGQLNEFTHERQELIDGHKVVIPGLLHSLCNHCGEYITTPTQSRYNKQTLIEARQRAVEERDRAQRLTPSDILRIRNKLGVTQVQAARVFGGGQNAFSKYENAEISPSGGMEKLLRLADNIPEAANWLLKRAGLRANQPDDQSCRFSGRCVVFKRMETQSRETTAAVTKYSEKVELCKFSSMSPPAVNFIYTATTAANDSRDTPASESLAAVG